MSDIEIVELECTPEDHSEQNPEIILPDLPDVPSDCVENGETPAVKNEPASLVVDAKDELSFKLTSDTNETKSKLPVIQEKQTVGSSDEDVLIYIEGKAGKIPKRKSQITDEDIQNLIVKCSACGKQVNHHYKEYIKKHRHLGVLICKECFQFYSEGEFSEDDTGYNYCRWCAQGGKLYGCDFCPNTFCFECVRRNFGRGEARRIQETEKWKCYLCEPSVLKEKVQFCDVIIHYAQKLNEKKKKITKLARYSAAASQVTSDSEDDITSSVPGKWLPFHINRVIFLCSKLQKRMLKLKVKQEKKEKSTKQIVAKFGELIDTCSTDINGVQKAVQNMYSHYMQQKNKPKVEVKKSPVRSGSCSEEVIDISDDGVKPKENLGNIILNGVVEGTVVEQVFDCKVPKEPIVTSDCLEVLSPGEHGLNVTPVEQTLNGHVNTVSVPQKDTTISDAETEPNRSPKGTSPIRGDVNSITTTPEEETAMEQCLNDTLEQDGSDSCLLQSQSLLVDCSPATQVTCSSGDTFQNPELASSKNSGEVLEKSKAAKEAILSGMLNSDSDDHVQSVPENDVHGKSQGDNIRSPRSKKPLEEGKKYKGVTLPEQPSSETKVAGPSENRSLDEVSASSLSSSSSSGSECNSLTGKSKDSKTHKNRISFGQSSSSKNSASNETLLKYYAHLFNDPKLTMQLRIYLEKLMLTVENDSDLMKSPQTADVQEDVAPECASEENFDETFRRLSSLPKRKKKTSASERDRQGTTAKKSAPKKTTPKVHEPDDSCSEPFSLSSSSGDEESKKTTANKTKDLISMLDKNELARASLLDSKISSSDSSDSDIPVSPKKIVKTKAARKKDESSSCSVEDMDSADDFKLPKKKGKYDKLLKAQITERSSDSGQKEKQAKKSREKKHMKRKIISSDEDGNSKKSKENKDSSSSDSTDSESAGSKPKRGGKNQDSKSKKRKRIKVANSSNSDTGRKSDDDGLEGSQGKSRKNIRKIGSRAEETKEAGQAEKERRRRVAERQKLYNQITEVVGDHGEIVTKKMVLEVDPESKEEVVEIHPDVVEKLKPHQINGVKFMWECTIESLKQLKSSSGSGCILAHCMGLGKTLQVIAFLYTILVNKHTKEHFRTALVICPYNTVLNWSKEFEIWLGDAETSINMFEMAGAKDNYTRKDILQFWQDEGGVLIIGYDIFRRLVDGKMARAPKKLKEKVFSLLVDPGPDIVICDEGHILKNESSAISKATSKLKTQRRIVLTGTPLQNNLKEYHCMVHFVKPHLLGTSKEFNNRFVNPIVNGQCADSSEYDVKKMKKRVHILHKLLQGCVQRCDYSALRAFLPDKHEFVISVKLSDVQIKMYSYFLETLAQGKEDDRKVEGRQLFKDYNSLKNIWTHPYVVEKSYIRYRDARLFMDDDSEGSLADFIDDGSTSSKSSVSEDTDDEVKLLEDDQPSTSKGKEEDNSSGDEVINKWKTRSRRKRGENEPSEDEVERNLPEEKHWWDNFFPEEDRYKLELSGKMVLVFEILKECELIGDKVLLFSTNLLALNLLEELLAAEDEKFQIASQNQDENSTCQDYIGSWSLGFDYFRMDGSTNIENRKRWIDTFNDKDNERARLFMISTKAGSLGTNLVGANRVIMLDASWNPSHDVQAIFRVYRFGQVKPVYIYRLLAQGTMEEKIYDRQVTKLSLQCRVIDEQNIERHFNASDLRELYKFDPEGQSNRPTPMVPKDRLLAELLIKHKNWIVTYHEHDSLLQNITEDDLTEEERQIAWQEYENEREGIINNNMGNTFNAKSFHFDPNVNYELPDADKDVKRCVEYIKSQNVGAGPELLLNKGIVAVSNLQRHYGEVLNRIRNERLRISQTGPVPEKMDNYIGALMTAIDKAKSYTNQLKQQYYHFCLARNAQMRAQQAQKQQQWNAQQPQKQQQQWNPQQQQQFARSNVGKNSVRGRPPVFTNVPNVPQNWSTNAQQFPPPPGVRIVQISSTPGVGPRVSAATSSSASNGEEPIITEVIDNTSTSDHEQSSRPRTRSSVPSTVTITELD